MGYDRPTAQSVYELTTTPLPVGWRWAVLGGDTWIGSSNGDGTSTCVCQDTAFDAVEKVLQGGLFYDLNYDCNVPVINVVFSQGTGAIYRVLEVIDALTIVVEDPDDSLNTVNAALYGVSGRVNPVTRVEVNGDVSFKMLDATHGTMSKIDINGNGMPIEPMLLWSNSSSIAIITR